MESGRGPEFINPEELTEKGFSEKKSARAREGRGMDNSQIKKRKPVILSKQKIIKRAARRELPLKERVLAAYESNEAELHKLIKTLGMLSQSSFTTSNELVTQIRARQKIQEDLLNALVLVGQGELREDALSKEVQNLIK